MITLKLRTGIVGDNFSYVRGDEVDWPDDRDAVRMIQAGHAAHADAQSKTRYEAVLAEQPPAPQRKPAAKPKPEPMPGSESPAAENPALHSDLPVEELDLDEDTIATLKSAGLDTVGQVAAHEDLTQIDKVGKATAKKINQAVAAVA